ncbi:MAG: PrsW family intramembrane metalloprotease [bacterium]|nr:PrsW family intramembrane metalloprotease [bacterium]
MNILLIGILGLLPSIIWLSYYLKKDRNPEPKHMIIRVFLLGMIMVVPTYFIEWSFDGIFSSLPVSLAVSTLLFIFIGIALVEEVIKYLTVVWGALKSQEIDEPVDIMIYMIVAALGFAAAENMKYIFEHLAIGATIPNVLLLTMLRFFFSTFLHALLSGMLGYFMVLSFFHQQHKWRFLLMGFTIAIVLHGVFNMYILKVGDISQLLVPLLILIGLAMSLAWAFSNVRYMKSICEWTPLGTKNPTQYVFPKKTQG